MIKYILISALLLASCNEKSTNFVHHPKDTIRTYAYYFDSSNKVRHDIIGQTSKDTFIIDTTTLNVKQARETTYYTPSLIQLYDTLGKPAKDSAGVPVKVWQLIPQPKWKILYSENISFDSMVKIKHDSSFKK